MFSVLCGLIYESISLSLRWIVCILWQLNKYIAVCSESLFSWFKFQRYTRVTIDMEQNGVTRFDKSLLEK